MARRKRAAWTRVGSSSKPAVGLRTVRGGARRWMWTSAATRPASIRRCPAGWGWPVSARGRARRLPPALRAVSQRRTARPARGVAVQRRALAGRSRLLATGTTFPPSRAGLRRAYPQRPAPARHVGARGDGALARTPPTRSADQRLPLTSPPNAAAWLCSPGRPGQCAQRSCRLEIGDLFYSSSGVASCT